MNSLLFLVNRNIGWNKAAAPNNGVRPYFIRQIFLFYPILCRFLKKTLFWATHQKSIAGTWGYCSDDGENCRKRKKKNDPFNGAKKILFVKNFFSENALFDWVKTGSVAKGKISRPLGVWGGEGS